MADYVKIKMPGSPTRTEEYVDKEEAHKAADAVASMCAWSETPEGEDFWDSVHDRLREMAERGY